MAAVVAVAVEAAAADAPLVGRAAAEAAAGAQFAVVAAADAPVVGAAAPVAAADRVFAPSPGAAAVAVLAFVAGAGRPLFAGPRVAFAASAAVLRAGAPGPVACACSAALVDAAARVADCRSAADSMAEPLAAGRSAGHWLVAYWAAR